MYVALEELAVARETDSGTRRRVDQHALSMSAGTDTTNRERWQRRVALRWSRRGLVEVT